MSLWEFAVTAADGKVVEQTVVAQGADEPEAAASALAAVDRQAGAAISRPGRVMAPGVEARWREVCEEGAFPLVVSNSGRLALYARRVPD